MNKSNAIKWVNSVVTTLMMALFIYATYAFYYEFATVDGEIGGVLYAVLGSIAFGWFTRVFVSALSKKDSVVKSVVAFIVGAGGYHALTWITNAILNKDLYNSDLVFAVANSIIFFLATVMLFVSFIFLARKYFRVFNAIIAVVYFAVCCGGFYNVSIEKYNEYKCNRPVDFKTISTDEIKVWDGEKARCKKWFEENFLLSNGIKKFPFDFKINGVSLNDKLGNWLIDVSPESELGEYYQGGVTYFITLTHGSRGIVANVEATIYEDNATCEWTVSLKNTMDVNSNVISDFYALNDAFSLGEAVELYYSTGSHDSANDFSLMKKDLSVFPSEFSATNGRSSDAYMPYFNLSGEKFGIVLGIGWSGQWHTQMQKNSDKADIIVKQESFEGYLLPGEEVRSPLVSVSFYESENALKGFNTFRNWISDCVYPENMPDTITMMEVAGPASTATADQIIDTLNTFDDNVYSNIDNFWMDAGWYSQNGDWYSSVGTWIPDTSRYDNGIKELSDYAKSKGVGHVLWYEPERAYNGSDFYNKAMENSEWCVSTGKDFVMWNLANEDAFDYYCEYISNSLIENGVTVYRQDFNFEPLEYWQKADKEFYDNRKGICENHYVTNLYKYLDYICEKVPGLIIDNCASGGRRLDLEMTRRSVPVWRSDYNCAYHTDVIEATQNQTYNLSLWLPLYGTLKYCGSEYEARSSIMPLVLETFGTVTSEHFAKYRAQRELMSENYYPLTWGGYSKNKILAMQYSKESGALGTAFIYKRANVTDTQYVLKLNGLNPDAEYNVYNIDEAEKAVTLSGSDLMSKGLNVQLPEGEKALIFMFEEK